MRRLVAAAVAGSMLAVSSGSAFGFDPSTGQPWQRSRPVAAVAYFKLPFHAAKAEDAMVYGLAIAAPTLRSYGAAPLLIADRPKLLDLRFNGALPDTLRITGQVAWAQDPSKRPGEQRLNLFGGLGGWVLGLAGTAAAVYGIYGLIKKNCPAISTTTGACVRDGN